MVTGAIIRISDELFVEEDKTKNSLESDSGAFKREPYLLISG